MSQPILQIIYDLIYNDYISWIKYNTTSVPMYKTPLLKSWELRKLIFVLKLFVE